MTATAPQKRKPGPEPEYPVRHSVQFTHEQAFWLRRTALRKRTSLADVVRDAINRLMTEESERAA